ncbi:glycosyltransferase [Aeromicrobium ponti]|uniref:Glycosyltransferase involved in cell wall biosynthesis n=1 Tax=Cytobacillus oceanisediminis TaxID=665099 RepID=A0A562J7V0_9BACI|nr:glycosyltransferase [Cytobacillus oceanisediminis]TWH79227.1 glycosyltransferase involved in cell wall biosynthesis [Cytobacillus oceanisediminis]
MEKRIRVLHIFGQMSYGGAEIRTIELMKSLDRDNYQFDFCTLSGKQGELDDTIRNLGGEILPCNYRSVNFPFKFKQLLRNNNYDVVHSHVHTFSGLILKLAKSENVNKRIAHFRSSEDNMDYSIKKRLQRSIMINWIKKYATDIISVNKGSLNSVFGHNWEKDSRFRVIYNGIDTTNFSTHTIDDSNELRRRYNISDNTKLITHVGRFVEAKNHIKILTVFKKFLEYEPNTLLMLVGKGSNEIEGKCKRMAKELKIDDKIIFVGVSDDIPNILLSSDLLIFPSIWEGLPGVVLEACAAKLPVLASDLDGIREVEQYFPELIHCLPVELSDELWAKKAFYILNSKQKSNRFNMSFENSIFTIHKNLESLYNIYGDKL